MVAVVPMPRFSGWSSAYLWMRALAASVAERSAVAKASASEVSAVRHLVSSSCSTTSVASALAISPAAAPPMPSATMNSEPRGPGRCSRTSGCSVAFMVVRSATMKQSSLCSRVRPTSVRPKTWTMMSPLEALEEPFTCRFLRCSR